MRRGMPLGSPYWKVMGLIIMPQALKITIPSLVNTFISLFKDTSLVLIIRAVRSAGHLQGGLADPPGWGIPPKLMSLSP